MERFHRGNHELLASAEQLIWSAVKGEMTWLHLITWSTWFINQRFILHALIIIIIINNISPKVCFECQESVPKCIRKKEPLPDCFGGGEKLWLLQLTMLWQFCLGPKTERKWIKFGGFTRVWSPFFSRYYVLFKNKKIQWEEQIPFIILYSIPSEKSQLHLFQLKYQS